MPCGPNCKARSAMSTLEDQGALVELLRQQQSSIVRTPDGRRQREMRAVHPKDRRMMRTPPEHVRSEQLNMRVSPRWKQRVVTRAMAKGMSVTEYIVRAVEAYRDE